MARQVTDGGAGEADDPCERFWTSYSHVLPALQADAAAKLDAILTR